MAPTRSYTELCNGSSESHRWRHGDYVHILYSLCFLSGQHIDSSQFLFIVLEILTKQHEKKQRKTNYLYTNTKKNAKSKFHLSSKGSFISLRCFWIPPWNVKIWAGHRTENSRSKDTVNKHLLHSSLQPEISLFGTFFFYYWQTRFQGSISLQCVEELLQAESKWVDLESRYKTKQIWNWASKELLWAHISE